VSQKAVTEISQVLLFWMDKLMLVVLVSLLLMMPLYEQLMAHFFVAKKNSFVKAPWNQRLGDTGEIDLVKYRELI